MTSATITDLKTRIHRLKQQIPVQAPPPRVHDLAVACCYFNPCRYQSRLANYKIFRNGILKAGVRLLTVELAFGDDPFELSSFSGVLQLRTAGKNLLWQKERLLNIGIQRLIEEGYEKIAWLDADIVFHDERWAEDLSEGLETHRVCQVFDKSSIIKTEERGRQYEHGAVRHYYKSTGSFAGDICSTGFGWAARAEVLRKMPLYDYAVIGGGDTLFFYGCFFYEPAAKEQIKGKNIFIMTSPKLVAHYFSWAKQLGELVQGRVGYIPHFLHVLYHGEVKDRNYARRHHILLTHGFDPLRDIRRDGNACWQWASSKPELHRAVHEYFFARNEDGSANEAQGEQ